MRSECWKMTQEKWDCYLVFFLVTFERYSSVGSRTELRGWVSSPLAAPASLHMCDQSIRLR